MQRALDRGGGDRFRGQGEDLTINTSLAAIEAREGLDSALREDFASGFASLTNQLIAKAQQKQARREELPAELHEALPASKELRFAKRKRRAMTGAEIVEDDARKEAQARRKAERNKKDQEEALRAEEEAAEKAAKEAASQRVAEWMAEWEAELQAEADSDGDGDGDDDDAQPSAQATSTTIRPPSHRSLSLESLHSFHVISSSSSAISSSNDDAMLPPVRSSGRIKKPSAKQASQNRRKALSARESAAKDAKKEAKQAEKAAKKEKRVEELREEQHQRLEARLAKIDAKEEDRKQRVLAAARKNGKVPTEKVSQPVGLGDDDDDIYSDVVLVFRSSQ